MKTWNIVLVDSGQTKKIQVELTSDTKEDEQLLNGPFTSQLQNHVLLFMPMDYFRIFPFFIH
jgi:hypothetical protein